MYKPTAFLISAAALTSIFSFFFGSYYKEREQAYWFWLTIVAYGKEIVSKKVWMIVGCSKLKTPEYAINRTPREFYDNQKFYSKEKDVI
ncbi:MAG: hypothetical protein JRJ46_07940 [Deltaproteobacteria bacterium]|nr:hypothetical protein [Deltaproteobacteria bacterium]